jgi:hypothetical protein
MSLLQNLKGLSISREKLHILAPAAVIVVLILGYLIYAQLAVLPGIRQMQGKANQLAAAKLKIQDAQAVIEARPDKVKQDLASARQVYSDTLNLFLSEGQAGEALNRLYGYAHEAGAEIVELQALTAPQTPASTVAPAPTATLPKPTAPPTTVAGAKVTPSAASKAAAQGTPAGNATAPAQPTVQKKPQAHLYDARSYHLQVRGSVLALLGFGSRMKEAALPTFIVSNVSLVDSGGISTLTMDITLYTSPYSTQAAMMPATPSPEVATPERPTATPAAASYLVRPTNWPTDKPWPPAAGTATALPVPAASQTTAPGASPLPTAAPPSVTAAPATAQPSPAAGYTSYVVRRGDTLYSIARRFGTTPEAIRAANGLADNSIQAGQTLRIPK